MDACALNCPQCGWQTVGGQSEIEKRLRSLGLLRRAPNPPDDLVSELLAANLHRLTCDRCGAAGLVVGQADDADEWDDWQQAVVCEICKQPIPPERLEVLPTAKCCVDCQSAADQGQRDVEPEYCPKCGSLVELRVSRGGGTTRYKRFCMGNPPCRL